MAPNIYAYCAHYLLSQYQPDNNDNDESKDPCDHKDNEDNEEKYPNPTLPVCIISAGMAGLYTVMIFKTLDIKYQIIDADSQDRVGGWLFTYHFPGGGPYNYFVC